MQKKNYLLVSFLTLFVLCASGCNAPVDDEKDSDYPVENISYTKADAVTARPYLIKAGEEVVIPVNYTSNDNNFVRLDLKNTVNIKGSFNYHNIDNQSEKVSETFFASASEDNQSIRHFFDAFRPEYNYHTGCKEKSGVHAFYNLPMKTKMARGRFKKVIDSITLRNVTSEDGIVDVKAFYVSPRTYPLEEVYLQKGSIKIGADLMGGGTFTYLERLSYKTTKAKYTVDEIIDSNGSVYIGVDACNKPGSTLGSEDHHVNLINYFDAGRQLQQSFYADIGGNKDATKGQNGYYRTMCYTASSSGYYWPYNPVQGGDVHCNISQLIDYELTSDYIYIKCKPLDWAGAPNEDGTYVTDCYMENWYSIKDGIVFCKNNFICFEDFYDMDKADSHGLELPATYIVQPFNTYVTYQGTTPWMNDENGLVFNPNLSSWASGADIVTDHPEDWFAWVNEDKFGVGMYIPNMNRYASGRSLTSTLVKEKLNKDAFESPMGDKNQLAYNKKECTYNFMSCYVRNTCYTAPQITTTMLNYLPFNYSYALSVDYLPVMRNSFKNLYYDHAIDNNSIFVWDNAIKGK